MILDILNEIAAIGSTKEKEAILRRNADNELLKRIYRLTYSKGIQFYIKKWGLPKFVGGLELEDVLDFMEEQLATRRITGNAALSAFEGMQSGLSPDDAEVVRRVMLRDLECGASVSIANKVWKGIIPEQPQMLASSYDEKKILKDIKFPAYAQLKADGARAFAEIRGDELEDVLILSRAGNEYQGLNALKRQLIEMTREARQRHPGGVMIDGELVYHSMKAPSGPLDELFGVEDDDMPELSKAKEFNESRTLSNGVANKSLKGTITEQEALGMKFQVWDYVPLDVIYGKDSGFAYDVRFRALELMVKGYSQMILIENQIVHSLEEARVVYKKYIALGLEGIILKNINGFWENKRSKNLYKFKEVITFDARIVGVYPHKKHPGKAGGFYIESECGLVKTKAGSGLKDKPAEKHELDRTFIWENQEKYIGGILESECNGWLTADGRTDYVKLFLPIAVRMRHDKTVANTFEDIWGDFHEVTGL